MHVSARRCPLIIIYSLSVEMAKTKLLCYSDYTAGVCVFLLKESEHTHTHTLFSSFLLLLSLCREERYAKSGSRVGVK